MYAAADNYIISYGKKVYFDLWTTENMNWTGT
jgi:hypothetical protein